jgi:hypothetical protein
MSHDIEEQVDAVFQEKQPVECRRCHWYGLVHEPLGGVMADECRAPGAFRTVRMAERELVVKLRPHERNQHNDCADWERRTVGDRLLDAPCLFLGVLLALLGVCWRLFLR